MEKKINNKCIQFILCSDIKVMKQKNDMTYCVRVGPGLGKRSLEVHLTGDRLHIEEGEAIAIILVSHKPEFNGVL